MWKEKGLDKMIKNDLIILDDTIIRQGKETQLQATIKFHDDYYYKYWIKKFKMDLIKDYVGNQDITDEYLRGNFFFNLIKQIFKCDSPVCVNNIFFKINRQIDNYARGPDGAKKIISNDSFRDPYRSSEYDVLQLDWRTKKSSKINLKLFEYVLKKVKKSSFWMMIWSQYDGNKKIQVQSMKSELSRIKGKFRAIIAKRRKGADLEYGVLENDIMEFQDVIANHKPLKFPVLPPVLPPVS